MSFFEILKALIPLIIIVGLLYALLYFVKRYGFSISGKKNNLVKINVLSSKVIMPKKFITVVRVEDKLLVLGVSEHSISLLKELDSIENEDLPVATQDKENFLDILKKNLGLK